MNSSPAVTGSIALYGAVLSFGLVWETLIAFQVTFVLFGMCVSSNSGHLFTFALLYESGYSMFTLEQTIGRATVLIPLSFTYGLNLIPTLASLIPLSVSSPRISTVESEEIPLIFMIAFSIDSWSPSKRSILTAFSQEAFCVDCLLRHGAHL